MRLRIWGRLAAAAVGAFALAGSASAQTPARGTIVIPQVQVGAQPAPGPTAPTVPAVPGALPGSVPGALPGSVPGAPPAAAAGTPVAPAPGATVVTGTGGCTNCGTAARGFVMSATGGYVGTACRFGQPCNNGCGSFRSDLGMVFGSCKSFFSPCGPGLHGRGCNTAVGGTGPSGPFNPCVYDSNLNH